MKRFMGILFMLILNGQALRSAMVAPDNNHPENVVDETPGVLDNNGINSVLLSSLLLGQYKPFLELLNNTKDARGIVQFFKLLNTKEYDATILQSGIANGLLYESIKYGQITVIEQLLDVLHINPNVRGLNGGTALSCATIIGLPQIATLLIKYKADVNKRAEQGFTALHLASIKNRLNLVKVLLKEKANPNLTDTNLRTPLHYAVMNKSYDIIKELLKSGAQPDIEDANFQTPLDIALAEKDKTIIDLLSVKWCCW